jgi:hypothetical protein
MEGQENLVAQELHCHACDTYVQFKIDLSLNGNHVLNCPKCNHEHCRVVKDGVITDERWASRNDGTPTFQLQAYSTSSTSTFTMYAQNNDSASTYMYESWMNTATT